MNILVTGGGTEVDIDDVRSIKNFSKGTTASLMVQHFLNKGHNVSYIVSKNGKTPFDICIDSYKTNIQSHYFSSTISNSIEWANKYRNSCNIYRYRTYSEYSELLLTSIQKKSYDAVVLAAAVSDFGVVKQEGKNSKLEKIELYPLPKIISEVKSLSLNRELFLVGFKLLSGASKIDLAVASYNSIKNNDCDMVVANDFKELSDRKVLCFHKDLTVGDSSQQSKNVSEFIVNEILEKIS